MTYEERVFEIESYKLALQMANDLKHISGIGNWFFYQEIINSIETELIYLERNSEIVELRNDNPNYYYPIQSIFKCVKLQEDTFDREIGNIKLITQK